MIRVSFVAIIVSAALHGQALPPENTSSIFEDAARPVPETRIDRFVFSQLSTAEIHPVLCSDAVFVRRLYLDLLGKLPTAQEAIRFIDNPDSDNKRSVLIDQLLERREFTDYWSMKWGDTLRIKAEFPINLWPNAAQAYHRWVHASIAQNKPYNQFVREMLVSSGSNFRVGPVNFYRAIQNKTPEGIAATVALTFMGSRIESWPKEQQAGMAEFFAQVGYKPTSEWKEEIVFWDPLKACRIKGNAAPGNAAITTLTFPAETIAVSAEASAELCNREALLPGGAPVQLTGDRDPRELFSDWLMQPDNPWLARCAVNRTWAWLLGRGIIQEPDDIRADNPPSHPELLDWLEQELITHHYDMKHLIRLILNSSTYQLSSVTISPGTEPLFAAYPIRRLEAELLIDAINQITDTSDLYTSAIPEPFTYLPQGQPAVAIADGSISSPFLALFGRSARATGMATERDNQTIPAQWRHMLNSSHIQKKIEQGPGLRKIVSSKKPPREIIEDLYLTILSRRPSETETLIALEYGGFANPAPAHWKPLTAKEKKVRDRKLAAMTPEQRRAFWETFKNERAAEKTAQTRANQKRGNKKGGKPDWTNSWRDISWSLLNSPEFLYRH